MFKLCDKHCKLIYIKMFNLKIKTHIMTYVQFLIAQEHNL